MAEMELFVEATNEALTNIGGFATFLEGISGGLGGLLAMLVLIGLGCGLIILFYKIATGRVRLWG